MNRKSGAPATENLFAASVCSCSIVFPIMFATVAIQNVSLGETVMMTAVGVVIYLLLHGYLLATRGQSIGKLVAGARIVDYTSGDLLPLAKLIGLRVLPVSIVASIPMAGGILNMIDILFIFGSEQRCVHDLIAGTRVVKA